MSEIPLRKSCFNCGSDAITTGVKVKLRTSHEGDLVYNIKVPFGSLTGTEPILGEVCRKCGTITRLYVKNARRNWKTVAEQG